MTELEWLKQESGLTDDELKAMESVAGQAKFTAMLKRMIDSNATALKAKETAETERLAFEKRYNDEFLPEMRRVTQDSLRAQSEAAAARATLEKAREYGIVPEGQPDPAKTDPPRAPGSPDPNVLTRADLDRLSAQHSRAIITLQDLSADHHKLFGGPLAETQTLLDEVQRQHTLGHKDFTLRQAWESKFNVAAKREEMRVADQKKHDDEVRNATLKEYREKNGDHPGLRSGIPSRFSTYKPSDANQGSKPWQTPAGHTNAANQPWREKAVTKLREVVA